MSRDRQGGVGLYVVGTIKPCRFTSPRHYGLVPAQPFLSWRGSFSLGENPQTPRNRGDSSHVPLRSKAQRLRRHSQVTPKQASHPREKHATAGAKSNSNNNSKDGPGVRPLRSKGHPAGHQPKWCASGRKKPRPPAHHGNVVASSPHSPLRGTHPARGNSKSKSKPGG